MMLAGNLTHRIAIQEPIESQSAGHGALTSVWSPIADRWAEIITKGSREFHTAQVRHSELTLLVKMRGYCAVTEKMRVSLADGRAFEILEAWAPDGKACANAAEVWLACKEIL